MYVEKLVFCTCSYKFHHDNIEGLALFLLLRVNLILRIYSQKYKCILLWYKVIFTHLEDIYIGELF